MKDFSNASFPPDVIELMTMAIDLSPANSSKNG